MFAVLVDSPGAAWEKRGNTAWLRCSGCGTSFPASPELLRADAPPCHCPRCGHSARVGEPGNVEFSGGS